MQLLRSLLFTAGMIAAMLVVTTGALFTFPLPPLARYRFTSLWARFVMWWLRVTCRLDYRVEGRELLPPGPAIVLAKHQSAWETIAFQQIFPPQVWVLKRELMWIPFFGWTLALLQSIAIDRRKALRALDQVVRQGRARLDSGRWVVVFPEGTRIAPGAHGKYNPGGALLAARTGYPVVPVAHNAGEFWPRRGLVKRPGTIHVVIGPPIDSRGKHAKEINAAAEAWIENTMRRIGTVSPIV